MLIMSRSVYSVVVELINYKSVFLQFVTQQLILRYRRTFLGYLWTLINPLLMISIMVIVFSTLFKADPKTFAVFLFSGMIPWNCFNNIVSQSSSSFIQNESLIKKIYIPKIVFPLSVSTALLIESVLSFVAFLLIMICLGAKLSVAIFFLPIAYIILFVFTFGVALSVSVITVFFRDLQHVIVIILQVLFYLTPILYPKTAFVGKFSWILDINPIRPFIELFRAPLDANVLPDASTILLTLCFAILSISIGFIIFLRNEYKIVFRL